eukprot:4042855-Amphidinium_carterae.2
MWKFQTCGVGPLCGELSRVWFAREASTDATLHAQDYNRQCEDGFRHILRAPILLKRTILQIAGASPDQLSFYDELTAAVLSAAIMGSSSRLSGLVHKQSNRGHT